MEMIFYSHPNKTHFHKKGCKLGLILKVRVFGTRRWPIERIVKRSKHFPFGDHLISSHNPSLVDV